MLDFMLSELGMRKFFLSPQSANFRDRVRKAQKRKILEKGGAQAQKRKFLAQKKT
jgi:hypothetical protein